MVSRTSARWISLIAILALAGGYAAWRSHAATQNETKSQQSADKPRGASPAPVGVVAVEQTDFPIYLNGLGTVQGLNTVVVRTRVDGQIDKISFTEGQIVRQGDIIAQIDPRPYQAALDQAKAKKAQDSANLANANLDLQRYTKLGDFATRQQTDTQRSAVQQITAQIASDDAAIFNAQTQLDYATVRAPITGLTGFRQVDQGNIVNASTQTGIVTIAQIEPISVVFTAPEKQLNAINDALKAGPLKVTAQTPDGKRKLSEGSLSVVNNTVDTSSGTVRLKATFENRDHELWPGQSVSTRLLVSTLKDATVVPDDVVQHGAAGLYAFAVTPENKAEMRQIKVSHSIDGRSVIEDGLRPGERVIVSGQYKVREGSTVTTTVAASGAPAMAR